MQEERNLQVEFIVPKEIFVQAGKLTEGLQQSCSADGMRKSFSRYS